jgi:hypothetical protein
MRFPHNFLAVLIEGLNHGKSHELIVEYSVDALFNFVVVICESCGVDHVADHQVRPEFSQHPEKAFTDETCLVEEGEREEWGE